MQVIPLASALKDMNRVELAKAIREGAIIIYPTDTLYGIGCNATKTESVRKIADAKGRGEGKVFSVIAPSKEWITENTVITSERAKFMNSLFPGPYTLLLKSKINMPFTVSNEGKIGVRIPKNEFCDFIRSQGAPFITTSVNMTGNEPVFSIKDVPEQIKQIADYAIDAGEVRGISSRVFDISGGSLEIVRW